MCQYKFDAVAFCLVNILTFFSRKLDIVTSAYANQRCSIDRSIVSSIDRSIDLSKKFQQNSQNYLIPDKTTKPDVLGYKKNYRILQGVTPISLCDIVDGVFVAFFTALQLIRKHLPVTSFHVLVLDIMSHDIHVHFDGIFHDA